MTKRCVVCGEKTRGDHSNFCQKHGKKWDALPVLASENIWLARQVRANERRRYRELLRAADAVVSAREHGPLRAYIGALDLLVTAVRNAKARRSR